MPGSGLTSTIDPIGRTSSAGLYTFFQQSVLGGATQASNVQQDTSDGLVQIGVQKDPNAIGYVGLSHSTGGSGVRRSPSTACPAQARYIRNESYPLFRYDWGVVPTGHVSAAVVKFLTGSARASRPARSSIAPARSRPSTSSLSGRGEPMYDDPHSPSRPGSGADRRAELVLGALASCRRRDPRDDRVRRVQGVAVVPSQRPALLGTRRGRRHRRSSRQVNTGARPTSADFQIRAWPLI